jgi:hypothetical protein
VSESVSELQTSEIPEGIMKHAVFHVPLGLIVKFHIHLDLSGISLMSWPHSEISRTSGFQ